MRPRSGLALLAGGPVPVGAPATAAGDAVAGSSYIARLHRRQRRHNRVTALDADPCDGLVDLRAIKEPHEHLDKNWS